jgi:hypothetical protein
VAFDALEPCGTSGGPGGLAITTIIKYFGHIVLETAPYVTILCHPASGDMQEHSCFNKLLIVGVLVSIQCEEWTRR